MQDGRNIHIKSIHFCILILVTWSLAQLVSISIYVQYTYKLKGLRTRIIENILQNSQDWKDYKVIINFTFLHLKAVEARTENQTQPSLDITLVTQCSVNNLYHLVESIQRWNGPISIAVFTPGYHFLHAILTAKVIHYCYPNRDIKLHIVYPLKYPPTFSEKALRVWNNYFSVENATLHCSGLLEILRLLEGSNYALGDISYPHNTLRNIAKLGSNAIFMILLDIDVMPSKGVRDSFLTFISQENVSSFNLSNWRKERAVFVAPAFEMDANFPMPRSKSEIVQAYKHEQARVFHTETCPCCHKPTKYDDWLAIPESDEVPIAYEAQWAQSWEPFYISTVSVPDHDERFKQYGYDRISQVCELYVAEYSFYVLTNAFVVHKGLKRHGEFHLQKHEENRKNFKLFNNVGGKFCCFLQAISSLVLVFLWFNSKVFYGLVQNGQ